MQGALAPAPETLEVELKRAWHAIEAQKQAGALDYDVQRAQTLSAFFGRGMTQRRMAECLGGTHQRIDQLLRYDRFLSRLATTVAKIPEGRFRQYWRAHSDRASLLHLRGKGKEAARAAYEQQVFGVILEKLRDGEVPESPQPQRKKTRKEVQPKVLKGLSKQIHDFQVLKRKEVQKAYDMIDEDVRALIALSHSDRSTYSPGQMASHAKRLKIGHAALQKALKNKIDEWLQDVLS